ncbi:nucleotidyltransferase family protein [Candidatus Uhrbacteria bacterium]|nr:nucleotidyltransferase family protein [Candidatus Uhrbacteria bacterium]
MSITKIRKLILPIIKNHGASRAGIFGSVARGENRRGSDIDVLVEFRKNMSLLRFIHIKHELEDALGRKVDLVDYKTLKPALRKGVLKDEVKIL